MLNITETRRNGAHTKTKREIQMIDELHPIARSLATSWLAHTNPETVKMPTDIDPASARAFYLGVQCTLAGDAETAEDHYRVLQDADLWGHAGEAALYVQSLIVSAHALHNTKMKAGQTVNAINQLARIGRDLDALKAKIDRI